MPVRKLTRSIASAAKRPLYTRRDDHHNHNFHHYSIIRSLFSQVRLQSRAGESHKRGITPRTSRTSRELVWKPIIHRTLHAPFRAKLPMSSRSGPLPDPVAEWVALNWWKTALCARASIFADLSEQHLAYDTLKRPML